LSGSNDGNEHEKARTDACPPRGEARTKKNGLHDVRSFFCTYRTWVKSADKLQAGKHASHAFTWYFDYNTRDLQYDCSALLETQTTAFVKEIRPAGTQIDNLRAPISVFLETRALGAIIRVRYAGGTTDDASAAVGAKVAFIAYSHQSFWPHVRIANWTFTIALFTETTDCDSWLAPAHNQIGMML